MIPSLKIMSKSIEFFEIISKKLFCIENLLFNELGYKKFRKLIFYEASLNNRDNWPRW